MVSKIAENCLHCQEYCRALAKRDELRKGLKLTLEESEGLGGWAQTEKIEPEDCYYEAGRSLLRSARLKLIKRSRNPQYPKTRRPSDWEKANRGPFEGKKFIADDVLRPQSPDDHSLR